MTGRHDPLRTFAWPMVIGVLSLIGLVGALLRDGAWDAVGALALGSATLTPIVGALARRWLDQASRTGPNTS